MNSDTLLYRMVSSSWMQDGSPTTPTFKPTRKDNGRLSVYDGDQISPQDAYEHYASLGHKAVGVLAVTVEECESLNLTVSPDPLPGFPQHCGNRLHRSQRKQAQARGERSGRNRQRPRLAIPPQPLATPW